MKVSVVIPTFNAGSELSVLFERLSNQHPKPPDEIVVIDSGSRDGTRDLARKLGAVVVEWDRPFNHGVTRDAGIAASSGDVAILTVQDALPASDDWLARIAAHFEDPHVAGVSTRQIPPEDGPLELKIKAQLEVAESASPIRVSLADHPGYSHYTPDQRLELYRFDNVCSALRKSVWQSIPFGPCRYAEDMIWARRALEAGHTIVRDPLAPVIHAHRRSFGYEFRRGLLDAWVMDELFGYRYSFMKKWNRAKALRSKGGSGLPPMPLAAKLEAVKTYSAHVLARALYNVIYKVGRPLGMGQRTLSGLTDGI